MNERLLQYIWQFQHFNKNELAITTGEQLVIIKPGNFNTNQGPDFLDGRIMIGPNTWAGNIELHVRASDWYKHAHSTDANYNNVILHVVWLDDDLFPVHELPTLIIGDRIPKLLLHQYCGWMNSSSFIPCSQYVSSVEEIIWTSWKERLIIERLDRKYRHIKVMLAGNNNNWNETLWWLVARYFGSPVNAEAFEEIARAVPYEMVINKTSEQLEKLLLNKVQLLNISLHFLRMRPAAFPDLRLKKLSEFISAHNNLLNIVSECGLKELITVFPRLIIINAFAPILFAHGRVYGNEDQITKAVEILDRLPSETNNIIDQFRKLGIASQNASASQSLIELKTQYCDHRRCLECAIGNAIIKRKF